MAAKKIGVAFATYIADRISCALLGLLGELAGNHSKFQGTLPRAFAFIFVKGPLNSISKAIRIIRSFQHIIHVNLPGELPNASSEGFLL